MRGSQFSVVSITRDASSSVVTLSRKEERLSENEIGDGGTTFLKFSLVRTFSRKRIMCVLGPSLVRLSRRENKGKLYRNQCRIEPNGTIRWNKKTRFVPSIKIKCNEKDDEKYHEQNWPDLVSLRCVSRANRRQNESTRPSLIGLQYQDHRIQIVRTQRTIFSLRVDPIVTHVEFFPGILICLRYEGRRTLVK